MTRLQNTVQYQTSKSYLNANIRQVFEELPANLRSEIAMEMHNGIIKKIKFFEDKDSSFIGQVVTLLTPLETKQNDVVYRKQ